MVLSKDLKKAIAFGLIIGVLFSICSFCFATDEEIEISPNDVSNLAFDSNYTSFRVSSSSNLHYFDVIPGATYRVFNTATSDRRFGYSSEVPAPDVQIIDSFVLPAGGSSGRSDYITVPSDVNYLFLTASYNSDNRTVYLYLVDNGLNGFINDLTYSLSFDNLGEIVVLVVPILAIGILFALGFYFIKRILNKTKKTKGGV